MKTVRGIPTKAQMVLGRNMCLKATTQAGSALYRLYNISVEKAAPC